jgi:hypothetical protein
MRKTQGNQPLPHAQRPRCLPSRHFTANTQDHATSPSHSHHARDEQPTHAPIARPEPRTWRFCDIVSQNPPTKTQGETALWLQHRRQELADSQMASAQPKSCSSCLAVTLATHELALNLGPRTNFNPRSLQFSPPPCRLIDAFSTFYVLRYRCTVRCDTLNAAAISSIEFPFA